MPATLNLIQVREFKHSYRAINRLLEKTGSEYRVDAPDGTAYETDLAALERLAQGNIMYASGELFHEAAEVYDGEKRLLMRDDGTIYDAGFTWDSTSLLLASNDYEKQTAAIDGMADRWSSTVLPTLKHISAYEDKTDPETGETITAAQQIVKDFKEIATVPEIARSEQPEIEQARKIGAEKAAALSAEIPDKYKL